MHYQNVSSRGEKDRDKVEKTDVWGLVWAVLLFDLIAVLNYGYIRLFAKEWMRLEVIIVLWLDVT